MRETRKQIRTGTVVSDRMDKTVVVQIETVIMHPQFKKYMKQRRKLKAHDEKNECRVGDRVSVMETRPLSRDKRWRVTAILEHGTLAKVDIEEPEEVILKSQRITHKAAEPAAGQETVETAEKGDTDDTGSDAS